MFRMPPCGALAGGSREPHAPRFIFLETVAGIPGMVSGSLRHLRSLRTMEKDRGW